jgi:hypothetical protein
MMTGSVNPARAWLATMALLGCADAGRDGEPQRVGAGTGGAATAGAGAGGATTAGAGGSSTSGGAPTSGMAGTGETAGAGAVAGAGRVAGAAGSSGSSGSGGGGGQGASAGSESRGGAGSAGEPASGGNPVGGAGAAGAPVAGTAGGGAGGAGGATIVPDASWACGMPGGIPAPERGEPLFEATLELTALRDVGVTQYGHRRLLDIEGGTITGDRLSGSFLEGGIDFELTLSNGSVELEQVGTIRASNGALIYLRTCGVALPGDSTVRVVLDFEVANSNALSWLNTGTFVATRVVDEQARTLTLTAYDMDGVDAGEPRVTLSDPDGVPDQPWDCATGNGTRGAQVFTETVGIGSSLSVGQSKRGNRNVIPITGGTTSGRVTGTVVPGGADFQIVSGTTTLDARYSLSTDDDEFIVVRNCGPFGALIPTFEARAAGPYAFLNDGNYVSSDPGSAAGGVSITFYERN